LCLNCFLFGWLIPLQDEAEDLIDDKDVEIPEQAEQVGMTRAASLASHG
jgi:hypothetical protein